MYFGILFSLFCLLEASFSCNVPPAYWCNSPEVAKECQVELQCEKYVWPRSAAADPVQMEVYIESLCPDCKAFINNQLWPTWKQLSGIMDLVLVPYGNAREYQEQGEWRFQCQHGPEECYGNIIETCAIHLVKNVSVHFPFIHCIEAAKDVPRQVAPKCADQFGLDFSAISKCVLGPLGNQLEHQMALKTEALKPPHRYVPWVVINGVHTEEMQHEAQANLKKLICDTYKGPKPAACSEDEAPRMCMRD